MAGFYRVHNGTTNILRLIAVFSLGIICGHSFSQKTEQEIWEDHLKTKSPVMVCRYVSPWSEPELRQEIIDLLDWTVPKTAPLVITCVEDRED